jgi:hypothetical protein
VVALDCSVIGRHGKSRGQPQRIEEYAQPAYFVPRHRSVKNTGRFNMPVPVIRCKTGDPVLKLDLGELAPSLYAVRVIGAVKTKSLETHCKPLTLRMTVNDGANGESSPYRIRIGYVDEFCSVVEFYFHATAKRKYRAELSVDAGRVIELLVHDVDLHDVLAGYERPTAAHLRQVSLLQNDS